MSTENTQDNTSFKGFWGTVKSAFKELAEAKKKKAQAKYNATKDNIAEKASNAAQKGQLFMRFGRMKAKQVSHSAAEALKTGAKKTLVAAGRGAAAVVNAPRVAGSAIRNTANKVKIAAVNRAQAFKQSARRTGMHAAWNVRNVGRNISAWFQARREAAKQSREQAQNRAKAAMRLARMTAKRVSRDAAASMKAGAKKTLVAAGRGAAFVVAAPVLAYQAGVLGAQKVSKIAHDKAQAFKQGATRIGTNISRSVSNIGKSISGWFRSKGEAIREGYTGTKQKAANFLSGAAKTIAGSQIVKNARTVSSKTVGLIKAGYEQESHKQAVLNRALAIQSHSMS